MYSVYLATVWSYEGYFLPLPQAWQHMALWNSAQSIVGHIFPWRIMHSRKDSMCVCRYIYTLCLISQTQHKNKKLANEFNHSTHSNRPEFHDCDSCEPSGPDLTIPTFYAIRVFPVAIWATKQPSDPFHYMGWFNRDSYGGLHGLL